MRSTFLVALLGALLWYGTRSHETPAVVPIEPTPDSVTPRKPLFPRLPRGDAEADSSSHVNGPEYNGVSVQCDLPPSEHLKNKGGLGAGGPGTGAGLCVFTSIDMDAVWQNFQLLIGFRDYMTKFPGGGYPDKVVQYMNKIAKDRGLPPPVDGVDFGQFTDGDDAKLDAILKTRRMAGVTYGYSPRYGPTLIAHMVCLVYLDDKYAAILDNNFPGTIEWMSRAEFLKRWRANKGGWAFWLGNVPPPPVPVNK